MVPTMEPWVVSGDISELGPDMVATAVKEGGEVPMPAAALAIAGFANPKSSNFAPDAVSITLPGLRSR